MFWKFLPAVSTYYHRDMCCYFWPLHQTGPMPLIQPTGLDEWHPCAGGLTALKWYCPSWIMYTIDKSSGRFPVLPTKLLKPWPEAAALNRGSIAPWGASSRLQGVHPAWGGNASAPQAEASSEEGPGAGLPCPAPQPPSSGWSSAVLLLLRWVRP